MQERFCTVITTVDTQSAAEKISEKVLEAHLGACVQQFPIQSRYRWQGKIESASEIRIEIKTRCMLFDRLKTLLLALHPYELPEIISCPINDAHQNYLDWIRDNTLE